MRLRFVSGPGFVVVAVALALGATIIGLSAYQVHTAYYEASERAERETQNASHLLVGHTARTFEAVDRALNAAIEVIDGARTGKIADPGTVHEMLRAIHGGSPVLYTISFANAAGDRLYTSRARNPAALNVAGQEYFHVHVDNPDLGIHVAAPIRLSQGNEMVMVVSRRVNDAQGVFAGVISVMIRSEYFNSIYRTVNLGQDGSIVLVRMDATLLVREPPIGDWQGKSLATSPWFRIHLPRANTGTYRTISAIDGLERVVSYGAIPGLPLTIAATMSSDTAMAAFYGRLRSEALSAALMLAATIAGAGALFVSLRRQAEATAANSLLANAVESSNEAIITRDNDGRITSWNAGASRMYGYAPEEAIGQPDTILVPADRLEEHAASNRSIAQGAAIANSETVRLGKDGKKVDISLTVTPLRDPRDGTIIGASSIARNIVDRKRREVEAEVQRREVAEKSALLKSAFTSMNQGVGVFDSKLRLAAWNEQLVKFMGLPESMFEVGIDLESMLRAVAADGAYGEGSVDSAVAERMAQTRLMQRYRYERRIRDGKVVDVQWTPMPNGFFAITYTDITEQKRIEDALRKSEERLAQAHARLTDAIECMPDGFLLWDAEDRLVLFNQAAVKAHGADRDGAWLTAGVKFGEILERRVQAGLIPAAKGHESEYIRNRVERHRHPTGVPIEQHFADGHWESICERRTREGGVVVIRTDITQVKRREIELAAAREAAEAANLAKSDFLSRMSHELRTPLNAVIGFAQMLELDRPKTLTQVQKDYCRDIEQGGRHLLALVNEVLDLARVESGRLKIAIERVSIADTLSAIRDTMAPLAEKAGVVLTFDDTADMPDLRADDMRLRQVMINLVSNAIKYNRPGGFVGVSAVRALGERVRLIVRDTGMGIAAEHHDDLFTPFHRGDAEFTAVEGTGIGLTITKRLVEAMAGEIGFASAPGQGSTFWIELPIDSAGAAEGVPDIPGTLTLPTSRATAGGYSLLYVEDNPVNLRLMEHLISTLPDVVMLSAASARLGLDLALAHRPSVIVLDLHMPEMNGLEMLARLRSMPETADIPVLALTAAAMPRDIQRGLAAGFFRYVTKPLDVKAFLAAVDAALDSREARVPATA